MRIRRAFQGCLRPPIRGSRWPRRVYRFAALSVSKARADNLTQQAAALAFITMVSLVPLLAALSFLGARWFDEKQERTVEILIQVLPYSEETIMANLRDFLEQAAVHPRPRLLRLHPRLRWPPSPRSRRRSTASGTSPNGSGRSAAACCRSPWSCSGDRWSSARPTRLLFYLKQRPAFQSLSESLPVQLIPFTVTVLGLTMLYWLVPYTTVRFRSALAGGLTAALLLEVLRQGFGIYVEQVRNISLVYGGFGLLLFFMLSIQLAWWIVLLGSEAAYSLQNAAYVSSRRRPAAPLEGSWVALAALVVHRPSASAPGKPVTPHELLAERMQLVAAELGDILAPLLDSGVVCESSGDTEGLSARPATPTTSRYPGSLRALRGYGNRKILGATLDPELSAPARGPAPPPRHRAHPPHRRHHAGAVGRREGMIYVHELSASYAARHGVRARTSGWLEARRDAEAQALREAGRSSKSRLAPTC